MYRFTWVKENQLVQDGKEALSKYSTPINFNQLFIMILYFIIDQLIHGLKVNSRVTAHNINGWIKEQTNGLVINFQFSLTHRSMILIFNKTRRKI